MIGEAQMLLLLWHENFYVKLFMFCQIMSLLFIGISATGSGQNALKGTDIRNKDIVEKCNDEIR